MMEYRDNLHDITFAFSVPEPRSTKLAVLLPGFLESQDYAHMVSLRKFLAQKGFIAVSFDAPGIWASDSLGIEQYNMTSYIKAVGKITAHFQAQYKIDQIILIGHSMGGKVAILVAADDPNITAVVGLMTPFDPSDRAKWNKDGWRSSTRDLPNDPGQTITFETPLSYAEHGERYNVLDKVKNLNKPLLLIAGEQDDMVPPASVEQIYRAASEPKTFIILPGIHHGYRRDPGGIELVNNKIGEFLKEALV